MSTFFHVADAIRLKLMQQPELADITIETDRQSDLASIFSRALGGIKGALIVVTWGGGENSDQSAPKIIMQNRFKIGIFAIPVLRKGQVSADDIIEITMDTLHFFQPEPGAFCHRRLEFKSARITDVTQSYFLTELDFEYVALSTRPDPDNPPPPLSVLALSEDSAGATV